MMFWTRYRVRSSILATLICMDRCAGLESEIYSVLFLLMIPNWSDKIVARTLFVWLNILMYTIRGWLVTWVYLKRIVQDNIPVIALVISISIRYILYKNVNTLRSER